ncbi:MAG TPA: P-II family nitrogen regulator [Firmicutes bacterium]|nr:P-II family nitrogen regulator [Bacillota bacterium]
MSDTINSGLAGQKLIVTIVQKGRASRVVAITKKVGAQGGTILLGRGTGIHEYKRIFGIILDPEKELILTLASQQNISPILDAIVEQARLSKPGNGVCFVLDVFRAVGIVHLQQGDGSIEGGDSEVQAPQYDLIVTIVDKGFGDRIVEISKKAGAEGGTILYGRGTGIHEKAKLFGIPIEPEKEMVLTLIPRRKSNAVLETILEKGGLNKPGKGIAFVLHVEEVAGINHPAV